MRVFALSNWTELDVWEYIMLEKIQVVPLYFAARRPVVRRNDALIMVDDGRLPLKPNEIPEQRMIRFRTLGCYPLSGAIESSASTVEDIVAEMRTAKTSERQGRLIDSDEAASMEKKEAGGLFLMDEKTAPQLATAGSKDQLRFLTCGSVDDGKSTLIGRLLYDSKLIHEDQLTALQRDSARHGTTGDGIDFALLVDGLEAEREQGITIDVAYRFFNTSGRSFIVADTPGHEQYTRNMATGASNAQLAIVLVDARKGVMVQTRRHSFICSLFVCSLFDIRHVVLAVNKIDLIGYNKDIFDRIVADYAAFASGLGFTSIDAVPISARFGDNIITARAIPAGTMVLACSKFSSGSTFDRNRKANRSDFRCNG